MAQAVKPNEGPRPVQVRLLGAPAVVQHPDALTQLIEQPDGLQGRQIDRRNRAQSRARKGRANDGWQHGNLRLAVPRTGQAGL
jgi:hypothetical protein